MALVHYGSFKTKVIASQFVLTIILEACTATWSTTPNPYYQRFNDGSYNYGYSTGGGYSARQSGTAANEVSGQYSQLLPDGKLVNVRYNAGVGGFRPQVGSGLSTTARPYGFSYNTGDAFHQAAADQSGNVRGNYWYRDPAGGRHDLRYRAGPGIGFVPTGGSLATPNGLGSRSLGPGISPFGVTTPRWNDPTVNAYGDSPDGRFPYFNPETSSVGGIYDPNGAHSRSSAPTANSLFNHGGPATGDGSYNFGFRTPDSARQEGSDGRGNVHGAYSFRNGNGNHDLDYVAGPGIGFQPTGGTLARPNGLGYGGGVGTHGNTNNGARAGIGGTRPTLGSTGGINNAGANGGDLGASYNTGGSGNTGAVGQNGGLLPSSAGSLPGSGNRGTSQGGVGVGGDASGLGSIGELGHGLNSAGSITGGSSGIGGGVGGRPVASGTSGIPGSAGHVGDGSTGSGLGLRSAIGGVPRNLGSRGVIDGDTGSGLGSAGSIRQGINSAGTNAGGSQGLAGGLGGGGHSGVHGHNQPNLANSNAARGFGGQGYGPGGLATGSSNGINRSGGHYHPDSALIGDDRGQNVFASNAANLHSKKSDGGFGSRGNNAYGSGFGANGRNSVDDRQRLGTTGTGGYSYGTPAAGLAGGSGSFGSAGSEGRNINGGSSGSFGSGGSGSHGLNGGGHSAGLSVEPLQSTVSGAQSSSSGSSSDTSGGAVSGEQHDLQRNAEPEQTIQSIGESSATKGISKG